MNNFFEERESSLFRFADRIHKLLILFGTLGLGSIGNGLSTLLTMLVISGVINEYGSSAFPFPNEIGDKVQVEAEKDKLLFLLSSITFYLVLRGFSQMFMPPD